MPPSDSRYTIGQLAAQFGLPTSTVRYYERQGLLRPDARSAGNYRLYSGASAERLRFILAAKEAGFTLENIRMLLDLRSDEPACAGEVEQLVADRLSAVREQLQQLGCVERVLEQWLTACRLGQPSGRCEILERLQEQSREARGESQKCP